GEKRVYDNQSPLMVNLPGAWSQRPGELVPIEDEQLKLGKELSRYTVERGVVMAGTHMKTYTRLTTMEAANESARHAVNAIIQDLRKRLAHEEVGKSYISALERKRSLAPKGVKVLAPLLLSRLTPCDIWPIERREVDDFKFLKELDREL